MAHGEIIDAIFIILENAFWSKGSKTPEMVIAKPFSGKGKRNVKENPGPGAVT